MRDEGLKAFRHWSGIECSRADLADRALLSGGHVRAPHRGEHQTHFLDQVTHSVRI